MRQKTVHYLFLIAMMGIGLAGCKSDVKLDDLTVDGKIKAKLDLPIGEVTTTFGDLIGLMKFDEKTNVIINENGILELIYTEHHVRNFHKVVVEDYIGKIDETAVLPSGASLPAGVEKKFEFPMTMTFQNVNDDLADERLDSMVIDTARFVTNISPVGLGITADDVKKVTLVLGSQFRRKGGNTIDLPDFKLNEDNLIEVHNFTLNLMKDETKDPASDNVVNTADITFVLTMKTGETVPVSTTAGFRFQFKVTMMSYVALYGFFKPSNQTRHTQDMDIPIDITGDGKTILPIKEPVINLTFNYGVSMPLDVWIKEISAKNTDGTKTYAKWNGETETRQNLKILDIKSPMDAFQKDVIVLDKREDHGQFDLFFEHEIDKLHYDYELEFNPNHPDKKGDQFRLTNHTDFILDFEFRMPFEFKKGMNVTYTDTLKDVTLEKASLDSIAKLSNGMIQKIEKADLVLYLVIENEIPVDLKLDVEFLDENNKNLELAQLTGIEIAGAECDENYNVTPSQKAKTIGVKAEDFDTLAKTRNIRFKAHLGDDQKPTVFLSDKKLKIKAGITGDVEALMSMKLMSDDKK